MQNTFSLTRQSCDAALVTVQCVPEATAYMFPGAVALGPRAPAEAGIFILSYIYINPCPNTSPFREDLGTGMENSK